MTGKVVYVAVLAPGLSEKCKGNSKSCCTVTNRAASDIPDVRLKVRIHKEYHLRNKEMLVWGKMCWYFG